MGSKEMTKDDEKVERIASLAAYFMQARSAVSSEAIHTRFYPSLSVDSFNKAFSRDRADLAICGLVLLLAVCRSNPDVLVELVQVVMCHGHAVRPFGKSLMRLVRCCIQSRQ